MTYITGLSCSGDCDSSFEVCHFSFISMTNELMIFFSPLPYTAVASSFQIFAKKKVSKQRNHNYFIAYILFCNSHSSSHHKITKMLCLLPYKLLFNLLLVFMRSPTMCKVSICEFFMTAKSPHISSFNFLKKKPNQLRN